MSDFPFEECCATAEQLVRDGHTVYQKWTCDACGERVTANKPNTFTTHGHHEDCGYVTNIKAKGCNYVLIAVLGPKDFGT